VLIASDSKGQYRTALTIGDEIRTTLTPLTFSKPIFNGLQWDFQSDKYSFTTLFSRVNYPAASTTGGIPAEQTNNTTLIGMRGTAQIGGYVRVGATYVNAHTAQTLLESFQSNPLKGNLTTFQNSEKISKVIVRLSDDSPEDNEGGAALYMDDIVVHDIYGRTWRGSEHGFHSLKEGGYQRPGYLAADGDETITLTYDFTDPSYAAAGGPDRTTIDYVTIEMVLANDYKVEWTSDRQTNVNKQPVFLLVDRAPGNVKDNSNQTIKRYTYGLPTGVDIAGVTLEVNDFQGFNIYAEFDHNRQYRQYPNLNLEDHHTAVTSADAWYVNVSKLAYPWFGFAEIYNIDPEYTTTAFMCAANGFIDYEDKMHYAYELVDDNDDQDRTPDWPRAQMTRSGGDQYVFPGWDENNDFKSDFNENDSDYAPSLIPDYEEPFLRYNVDRPEFLFGIDMNNNLWVDRFENDDEPDYPYKRDRRGFNVYAGVHLTPDIRLTVGAVREKSLAERRRNYTNYFLFTLEKDWPRIGKLRIFHNLKLAKDNIPEDLFQWVQPPNSRGTMEHISDPLAGRNTWINSSFLSFTYRGIKNLNIINKVKYDWWHLREPVSDIRRDYRFFGLINKADYTLWLWKLRIQPRIKNEFRREVPVDLSKPERKEDTLLLILLGKFPVLRKSEIELGLEYTIFNQLMDPVPPGLSDDYRGLVFAVQFTNHVDYLGYRLTTQIGIRMDRRMYRARTKTTTTSFVTVYAGAE